MPWRIWVIWQAAEVHPCAGRRSPCSRTLAEAHASLGFLLTGLGRSGGAPLQRVNAAIDLQPDFAIGALEPGDRLICWAGDMAPRAGSGMSGASSRFPARVRQAAGRAAMAGRRLWGRARTSRDGRCWCWRSRGSATLYSYAAICRCLWLQGTQVILECAPALMGLLRCLPDITLIPPRAARPPYDAWVDQMSLPRLFGTTLKTIPSPGRYLKADPARRAAWAARLPAGLRVGLVWAGNPAHSNDRRRSAPIAAVAPLLAAGPWRLRQPANGTGCQ